MNYILCEYNRQGYDAGSKARNDTLKIAGLKGYKFIPLFKCKSGKIRILFQIIFSMMKVFFIVKKNEIILLQYPYYPNLVNKILFKLLKIGKKIKGFKLTLLIHDVLSLRNEKLNSMEGMKLLQQEVLHMQIFDKIICHNELMLNKFKETGVQGNFQTLGIFDYLYDKEPVPVEYKDIPVVIIAGNLTKEKCGYLYKLPKSNKIKYRLYGAGYNGNVNEQIEYMGKFPPDELIEHLDGNYGLVWDGELIETCSGIYGQYLQYNNPHKFSLYVAAGLPLIVWSKSALAKYVKDNQIGICIDSLLDLENVFDKINANQYLFMRANLIEIRKNVISGNNLKSILD